MKKKALLKLLLVMLFAASIMILASCSKSYTVTYDADGGTAVPSVEVKAGEKIGTAPVTTKEGYTFDGWYLNSDKWDFAHYNVTKNITLKAKWLKNYNVTFDSNGGSEVEGFAIVEGTKIAAPANPIKSGAEFIGWYDENNNLWDFNTPISSDVKLTAQWRNIFTVRFETDAANDRVAPQTVKSGNLATEPKTPTRPGHEFIGWYLGNDPFDFATPITSDITLTAKWRTIYTVTFDTQGAGSMEVLKLPAGALIPAPAEISKDGYVFIGWFDANGTAWDFATMTVSSKVTLTAKWIPFTYNVTIDNDNGDAPTQLDVIPNNKINEPAIPELEGYKFLGWYVFDDATSTLTTPWIFSENIVTSSLTIKAKWVKTWTVTFMVGDDVYNSYIGIYDSSLIEMPYGTPENGDMTFAGWYVGETPWNFSLDTVSSDLVLTAKFLTKHVVKFNTDGGNDYEDIVLNYGDKIPTPADPTKPNYIFAGWYDENGNLWDFENNTVTSNVTLKAKWATRVTVTLADYDTKLPLGSVDAISGYTIAIPDAPSKYGYLFSRWVTEDGVEWDFANGVVNTGMTLYAQWTENFYTVTFNVDGVITSTRIECGEKVDVPAKPESPTLGFDCWIDEATSLPFDFSVAPTGDVNLVAKWSDKYYTVTFISNNQVIKTLNVAWENPYATAPDNSELTPPSDGSYRFFGWYKAGSSTPWDFANDEVTGSMELVANWRKALTVTLKIDDNTVYTTTVAYEGSPAGFVIDPTLPGHLFLGWYDADGNIWNLRTNVVSTDITLTAKWKEVCTVYYDLTGGYFLDSDFEGYEIVAKGDKFTEPTKPQKQKFEFVGWIVEGSQEFWNFEENVANQDVYLHAYWIPKYYVNFDLNGGDGDFARQEIIVGNYATLPTTEPTKNYMRFVGWYLGDTPFDFAATQINDDITLKAKWEPITYSVIFNPNNGQEAIEYPAVTAGQKLTAPDVVRSGYILKGWQLSNGEMWDFDTDLLEGDVELKAVWTQEKVTISFDLNGGSWEGTSGVPSQTVEYNSKLENFADPYMGTPGNSEYIFKGWFRPDGTKWDFDVDTATESITLTAKWEKDYSVQFISDGVIFDTQKVPQNDIVLPPLIPPTKAGYDFLGWYVYGSDTKWDFATTVTFDLVLEARWQPKTFSVTFITLDPETKETIVLSTQTMTYGDLVTCPDVPSIGPNYQFDSWRDASNGRVWKFTTDVVTKDLTLQAFWVTPGVGSGGGSVGPWDENTAVQGPIHSFS